MAAAVSVEEYQEAARSCPGHHPPEWLVYPYCLY